LVRLPQKFRFAAVSTMPDRTHRVDDVFGVEVAAGGYDRFARGKSLWPLRCPYALAFFEDLWSAFAVNSSVYASAAHERRVRRVHDGVSFHVGDVALNQADTRFPNSKFIFTHFLSQLYRSALAPCHRAEPKKYAPNPTNTATQKNVIA
jgi:hypothetical protein